MEQLSSGAGSSTMADAHAAGHEAATAAMASMGARAATTQHGAPEPEPVLVLVYASVRYDLPTLLAGVRSVTGQAPLAGFTSCGHFDDETVTGPGQGATVLVLAGGSYAFGLALADGLTGAEEEAGITVTRAAKAAAQAVAGAHERPFGAMMLFTVGLGVDQQAVLTGVHRVAGAAVPVVGGAAGDDRGLNTTSVFLDDQVFANSVVGIWVASPRPLTVGSAHGWTPVSLPMLVTRSEGSTIHEIGGRPATEVFREFAARKTETHTTADGLGWQASYAPGLIEPDGSHLVRGVFTTDQGPLHSFTDLPAYCSVQVMTADPEAALSVIEGVVNTAMTYGDESVLLAFDCVARFDIMGDRYADEVARIRQAAGPATCFGVYTYGEFGRYKGIGGVHNATLTTIGL